MTWTVVMHSAITLHYFLSCCNLEQAVQPCNALLSNITLEVTFAESSCSGQT